MSTIKSVTEFKALNARERKALVNKVAKAKANGATGAALREEFGSWMTGPVRRTLLREYGHDGLVAPSYDRAAAKAKRREAAAAAAAAAPEAPAAAAAPEAPAAAAA